MGGISAEPSYIVGSAYSICDLSDQERKHLDAAAWVFCCNSFLSHWQAAGFRPSVWAWGDNHNPTVVAEAAVEFRALACDPALGRRPVQCFAAIETERRRLEIALRDASVSDRVRLYRRGQPWEAGQKPATELNGRVYHYGSTLTDLVNLAAILNPGQEIRVTGNPFGPRIGHFYDADRSQPVGEPANFWQEVQAAMWLGLGDLHRAGLPIVDCNARHEAPPPAECRGIPRGPLID